MAASVKIDRQRVIDAALELLDAEGLEALTLRRLATCLKVQAPTLYWHFKDKAELVNELATAVLAEGAAKLLPKKAESTWRSWTESYAHGLRAICLAHRDGARLIGGSALTDTIYIETMERIGARIREAGFPLRSAVVLLSTVYSYTLNFSEEEQAVYPRPGERSPLYDLKARKARLDPSRFPLSRKSGEILFTRFERRFAEGLALILDGAEAGLARGRGHSGRRG